MGNLTLFRLVVAVFMVFMSVSSSNVYAAADIAGAMSEFINSNSSNISVTQGGNYEGKRATYFVGGGIKYQTRLTPPPTIGFTAPSFQAGCSGIDFNLGAISIPSASEFSNFIKSVGQAAPGYAFKIALATLSPQVEGVLSDIQHFTGQINNMLKNACATTEAIMNGKSPINDLTDMKKTASKISECSQAVIGLGSFTDAATGNTKCQGYPNIAGMFDSKTKNQIEGKINYTWEAMKDMGYDLPTKRLYASLVGIYYTKETNEILYDAPLDLNKYICGNRNCYDEGIYMNTVNLPFMTCAELTYCAGDDLSLDGELLPRTPLALQIFNNYNLLYESVKGKNIATKTQTVDFNLGKFGRDLARTAFLLGKYNNDFTTEDAVTYLKAYSLYAAAKITSDNFNKISNVVVPQLIKKMKEEDVKKIKEYYETRKKQLDEIVKGEEGKIKNSESMRMINILSTLAGEKYKAMVQARSQLIMVKGKYGKHN